MDEEPFMKLFANETEDWKNMVVNEETLILSAKSDVVSEMCDLIRTLAARKTPVKIIRGDDASENKKLQRICKESKDMTLKQIIFEYTARGTPQYNGKVERWIATIVRMVRATLNSSKIPAELRRKLWGECVKYCTDIVNSVISRSYSKPGHIGFYSKPLDGLEHRRRFGEIGYVTIKQKMQAKMRIQWENANPTVVSSNNDKDNRGGEYVTVWEIRHDIAAR